MRPATRSISGIRAWIPGPDELAEPLHHRDRLLLDGVQRSREEQYEQYATSDEKRHKDLVVHGASSRLDVATDDFDASGTTWVRGAGR